MDAARVYARVTLRVPAAACAANGQGAKLWTLGSVPANRKKSLGRQIRGDASLALQVYVGGKKQKKTSTVCLKHSVLNSERNDSCFLLSVFS